MWRTDAPYTLAVSSSPDPVLTEAHKEREWFKEVFKVAVEVPVDELWFALEGLEWPVRRITMHVKGLRLEDGEQVEVDSPSQSCMGERSEGEGYDLEDVWWSTMPSPRRMGKRRQIC